MAKDGKVEFQQSPRTELARTLLAIADPIRLRMLNLMFAGELSASQFSRTLGVQEKIISRHLVLFRESRMVAVRAKRNARFYTIRRDPEFTPVQLLRLAVEKIEHDPVLKADLAMFYGGSQESRECDLANEIQHSNPIEDIRMGV